MYSGFNLKINAARDCGPDSINFLDPSYIDVGKSTVEMPLVRCIRNWKIWC